MNQLCCTIVVGSLRRSVKMDKVIANAIIALAMLLSTMLVTFIVVAVAGSLVDPVALIVLVPFIMMVLLQVFYGD